MTASFYFNDFIGRLVSVRGRPRVPTAKAGRSTRCFRRMRLPYSSTGGQRQHKFVRIVARNGTKGDGMHARFLRPFFLGPTNSGDLECLRFDIGTARSESPSVHSRPSTAVELPRERRVVLVDDKSIAVNGSARKTSKGDVHQWTSECFLPRFCH